MPGIKITVSPPNGTYNFVREWMSYADEEGRNLFFKFFCYFLAFNHLYESVDLWDRQARERLKCREHISDLDKVIAFLKHALIEDDGPRLNVVVEDSDYAVLTSVRWHNSRTDRWQRDNPSECRFIEELVVKSNDPRWKTLLALTKVYRIRCNLFHGEKHVTDDRDRRLVECSNNLLNAFLQECASRGLGLEHIYFTGNEE